MIEKLLAHLKACPGVSGLYPVRIKIGRTIYEGAHYIQEYRERYYLIGAKPRATIGRNCAFRFPNSERDWYVAAYMPAERLTPDNAQYHPCGENFLLFPWDIETSKIDSHARVPYRRMKIDFA